MQIDCDLVMQQMYDVDCLNFNLWIKVILIILTEECWKQISCLGDNDGIKDNNIDAIFIVTWVQFV